MGRSQWSRTPAPAYLIEIDLDYRNWFVIERWSVFAVAKSLSRRLGGFKRLGLFAKLKKGPSAADLIQKYFDVKVTPGRQGFICSECGQALTSVDVKTQQLEEVENKIQKDQGPRLLHCSQSANYTRPTGCIQSKSSVYPKEISHDSKSKASNNIKAKGTGKNIKMFK